MQKICRVDLLAKKENMDQKLDTLMRSTAASKKVLVFKTGGKIGFGVVMYHFKSQNLLFERVRELAN